MNYKYETRDYVAEFLKQGGEITKCKFSIDPAVKNARETIGSNAGSKFYQKQTKVRTPYDNFYRTPEVQNSINKMREVERDSNPYDYVGSTIRVAA